MSFFLAFVLSYSNGIGFIKYDRNAPRGNVKIGFWTETSSARCEFQINNRIHFIYVIFDCMRNKLKMDPKNQPNQIFTLTLHYSNELSGMICLLWSDHKNFPNIAQRFSDIDYTVSLTTYHEMRLPSTRWHRTLVNDEHFIKICHPFIHTGSRLTAILSIQSKFNSIVGSAVFILSSFLNRI